MGEAADGAEVPPLVARLRPDVVLMDVRMPDVDGIQATRHLVATSADPPRVLVVTTFENDDYVYDALRAGASGFLLKRARAGGDGGGDPGRGPRRLAAVPGRDPAARRSPGRRPCGRRPPG